MEKNKEFYISPDLKNDDLTESIDCLNESGENIKLPVVKEIPLTIYLNKQEIVTAMTLGCLLYTSPSPRDATLSRMPSSA